MPTLTLKFFVLTINFEGHIIWPTLFSKETEAALRKQARLLLQRLIEDPDAPVGAAMQPALAGSSGALRTVAPRRRLVEASATQEAPPQRLQ